jgi:hypothetical protein
METAEFIGQCLIMFSTRFGLDPGAQRVMMNFGEGTRARKPGNVGLPKIESMVRGTIPFIMKVMNQGLEGPRPTLQRGTSKRKSDMYAGLPLCDEPQSSRLIGSPAYAMFQAVDGASHFSPEFCPMSKYGCQQSRCKGVEKNVLTLRCGHSCCDECDRTVAKLRCVRCSVLFLSLTAAVALIHRNRAHNKVILLEDLKASVHYMKKNAIPAWLLQTAMRTVLKHSNGGGRGGGVGEGEKSDDDSDDFGVHADHDAVLAATLQDGELISEVDAWFRSTSATTTTMPPTDEDTSDFAVGDEGNVGDGGIFEDLGGGGKASGGGKQHIVPTATDADIDTWIGLAFTPSTHPSAERVLQEQAAQELERKRRIAANPAAAAAAKQDAKKVAAKKRGRTAEQAAKVDDAKRRRKNGLPAKKQGACASGSSTAAAAKKKSKKKKPRTVQQHKKK